MTNSELILLSLIAEKPRHGYEIETIIEERGMRKWTDIAFSSIYAGLNRLVAQGYASTAPAPAEGRGPDRKVYTATPAGLDALRSGLERSLRDPALGDQSFLFGLSCLPLLDHTGAFNALQARRAALQDEYDSLSRHPALTVPGFPTHVTAMFTYSLSVIQANLSWLDGYIKQYEGDPKNG
jgi:DNA-binding PadR family transcriptional regulator